MNPIRTTLLLLVVAAVAVAAPASAAPAAEATSMNIVATASADARFDTLTMLLTRAGLVTALKQRGPYTVVAPTDAAFAKVPKTTLNALLRDKAKLKAVLLYHVVKGKVLARDVVQLRQVKTLNGKSFGVRTAGSNVFLGGAQVTTPNVMASNGVIHVVDRVLIPPTG
jgi:uncharacterized surface protein with fasciclin (FAS1) repeats